MYVFGYILIALAKVIGLIINIYTFVIIIAVLISWVKPDPYNPIVRILHQLTEPVFARVRRFMPRAIFRIGLDLSPIIVLILLVLIETIVVNVLYELGRGFLVQL
ncbi:YggT family protein [bacterium]|nr:YggT family protein [bacterium]